MHVKCSHGMSAGRAEAVSPITQKTAITAHAAHDISPTVRFWMYRK